MKRLFIDLDGTIVKFNVRNALERFDKEEGFFARLKAYKGTEVVNFLAQNGKIFIVSASPNPQADADKIKWIAENLPNVPRENITLCRLGENKARVIESKYNITIDKECLLLDDYTKNLIEWESFGGTGIKRVTHCADNSTKKWKGQELKDLRKIAEILA